ncbi:hypothetical protein [Bifidobacterium dentium]|uniref:hypothetical protein n=1 Tax=Bifidobacterium dentium TaxID=1689 RepID=UPI0026DBDC2F|nr:hypothetical protein [Bifidobacterium dentium]
MSAETIEVWRGTATTDVDGNPIQGDPAPIKILRAMVAPAEHDDQADEGGRPDTLAYTLYIRGSQPTGIQPTDLVKVRGQLLHVNGRPQVWHDLHGRYVGDVIQATERTG